MCGSAGMDPYGIRRAQSGSNRERVVYTSEFILIFTNANPLLKLRYKFFVKEPDEFLN